MKPILPDGINDTNEPILFDEITLLEKHLKNISIAKKSAQVEFLGRLL